MVQKFTKGQNFCLFVLFVLLPAKNGISRGARWQGRTMGEKAERVNRAKGRTERKSERAKNGKIVPQNFRQRKSFLPDAVIRNYLSRKMLYLRPMVRDGQQERSRGAQATAKAQGDCKGHQPAGQRRRLQKRISAAQQRTQEGRPKNGRKTAF